MRCPLERSRLWVFLAILAGSLTWAPAQASAQEAEPPDSSATPPESDRPAKPKKPFFASPYVPVQSWEYPILDYWISAGRINSLSPFVQPYRRIEVAGALLELDESDLSSGEREWLARLNAAYAHELEQLTDKGKYDAYLTVELAGGATVASQTHRDPLRPELEGEFSNTKLLGDFRARVEGAGGPIAGAVHGVYHGIYLEDPQFPNGQVGGNEPAGVLFDEMAFRTEEAYVEVQSRYARLSVGQMYRNWGAPNLDGFLRSDYAYSEPDISYRVGVDRIYLIGMFASYPIAAVGAGSVAGLLWNFIASHQLVFAK